MVCNLVELDEAVRREVLERFDHENLNMRARIRDSCADYGKPE